jgi:hypothetical protein
LNPAHTIIYLLTPHPAQPPLTRTNPAKLNPSGQLAAPTCLITQPSQRAGRLSPTPPLPQTRRHCVVFIIILVSVPLIAAAATTVADAAAGIRQPGVAGIAFPADSKKDRI